MVDYDHTAKSSKAEIGTVIHNSTEKDQRGNEKVEFLHFSGNNLCVSGSHVSLFQHLLSFSFVVVCE